MHIEPQIALHAARPLMAAAAVQRRALAKETQDTTKIALRKDFSNTLQKWDPNGPMMKATLLASLPAREWEAMTSELYLTFWSLSLYDIKVPTKAYDAQIALLRAKYTTAQRDIDEPDKRKKEMTRCLNTIDTLTSELAVQKSHCKQVLNDLEQQRDTLLGAIVTTCVE